jgi:quercetin dioxygenase-like cupin family protein
MNMEAVICPNWQEKVVYSAAGPRPQVLLENDKLKVLIAGLEPGQIIPPHPETWAVYHFLDGTGWMRVDDDRLAVGPGATVIVPAGAERGIEAQTRLAFLATRVA